MKITVQQFIDAIRKNGYPQIKGDYIRRDSNNKVIGACVYGQAALNLSVNPSVLHTAFGSYLFNIIDADILFWNDTEGLTLDEIASRLDETVPNKYKSTRIDL